MNGAEAATVRSQPTQTTLGSEALVRLAFDLGPSPPDDDALLAQATRGLPFIGGEGFELDLADPACARLGDYTLLEKIGQGGMGMVFRARQESLDREVALKLLVAGPWASPDFIERFRIEARSAARMQHPNIATVHEIDVVDGLPFFSMRLVKGVSLAERVRRQGPVASRRAAELMKLVAEAVDYAHRLGVLHLDLKPGNILLDENDQPQIADFGLARRLGNLAEDERGEISGTPSYMAPEQAMIGGRLSERTDVYALGATLYELVAGCPPFHGATARETIELVITEQAPPPRAFARDLPLDLQAICLKCLSKDPALRYASARELADDLGRFLEGRAVRARPLSRAQRSVRWVRREPRLAGTLATLLLVLVAGLLTTFLQWQRAEQASRHAFTTSVRANRDLSRLGKDVGPWQTRMLPILENLEALEARGDTLGALTERRRIGIAAQLGPRLIGSIGGSVSLVGLAMDEAGDHLAIADADGHLRLIDTDSGSLLWKRPLGDEPQIVPSNLPEVRIEFSTDGQRILVHADWRRADGQACRRAVGVFDAVDGRRVHLPSPGERCALFSRDGRALVDLADPRRARLSPASAFTPLAGGRELPGLGAERWAFSADGALAARRVVGGDWVELFDSATGNGQGRFGLPGGGAVGRAEWLPDGRSLALSDANGGVWRLDRGSGDARPMIPQPRSPPIDLRAGTAGRMLAAASKDGALYVWDATSGAALIQPTAHAMPPTRAYPDEGSRRILVHAAYAGQVWDLPPRGDEPGPAVPAGSMVHRGLINNPASAWAPRKGLVATAGLEGETRLWRLARSPWLEAGAAANTAAFVDFDGRHTLDLRGRVLRVVRVGDEAPAAAWTFDQPVSHAAAAWSAGIFAVAAGSTLQVIDWGVADALRPPVDIGGTARLIDIASDGSRLVMSRLASSGSEEIVLSHALDHAAAPARLALEGPLIGLRVAADGGAVIVWGRRGSIVLADAASLEVRRRWPLQAPGVWLEATLSRDGRRLLATSALSLTQECWFWEWDVRSGDLLRRIALPNSSAALVEGPDGRVFVQQHKIDDPLEVTATGYRRVHHHREIAVSGPMAVSPDGSLLASATQRGIALTDLRDGQRLLEPPNLAIALPDSITQLAFAADGESLWARTYFGRQLVLDLRPDPRPVAEIREELLHSSAAADPIAAASDGTSHRAWRDRDPGPTRPPSWFAEEWVYPTPTTLEQPPSAGRIAIDAQANVSTGGPFRLGSYFGQSGHLTELFRLPLGVHRLGGMEFDIRNAVQLAARSAALKDPHTGAPYPAAVDGIAVGRHLDHLHVLMALHPLAADHVGQDIAFVTLHYADGSSATVPIRSGVHVLPHGRPPSSSGEPQPAWIGRSAWNEIRRMWVDYDPFTRVYALRLANPHPTRMVRALGLACAEHAGSAPLFLAISGAGGDFATASETHAAAPP